jgi:hypothetical protein
LETRRLPGTDGRSLQAALRRVDETLERSQALRAEGHDVAAVGLLKYVDLLLARFNPALARAGTMTLGRVTGEPLKNVSAEVEHIQFS